MLIATEYDGVTKIKMSRFPEAELTQQQFSSLNMVKSFLKRSK